MANDSRYTRRRLLRVTGGAAIVGLAGCTGSQPDDGRAESGPDDAPTAEAEDDLAEEDDHHEEDDHGHDHDEGTPQEPSATAEVALQTDGGQHHFAPHVVWVEPGGTVTWELESGQHDVVASRPDNGDKPLRMPDDAEPWDSGLLTEEDETVSRTFETEGVFDYLCTPHEAVGMVGTVIVGDPDPHEQPALEEPQELLPDGARSELADLAENVNEALGHTH